MIAFRHSSRNAAAVAAILLLGVFISRHQAFAQDDFTTVHHFSGGDGAEPLAGLIQDGDGTLYGTTSLGGTGYGTVFRLNPDGTGFTTLHSFNGSDGDSPYWAVLLQGSDGALYGTTYAGGSSDYGTVFRLNTDGTGFTTLHDFTGGDGAYPLGDLIQGDDGMLYGTTSQSGSGNAGTVFRMNTDGTGFTTLHSFSGSDGAVSYSGLTQGNDGMLYGTTSQSGSGNAGTVFRMNTDGTGFTTLHSFSGSDGAVSYSGLIQGGDGTLYGTTYLGGGQDYGTVFRLSADGTGFTTLHSFSGSDGAWPSPGRLIQCSNGVLCGTTLGGGAAYSGTLFQMNTDGGGFATLHAFVGSDGTYPYAGLVQCIDGDLYGTTMVGGISGYGTLFRTSLDPAAPDTLFVMKQQALVQLNTMLATAGGKDARKKIDEAIKKVTESLHPTLWATGDTLTNKGKKVFDCERHAVEQLKNVNGGDGVIGILVDVDRRLAQKAIDIAIASTGSDARKIADAQREMGKAAQKMADGKPRDAVEHYKRAWDKATAAVRRT